MATRAVGEFQLQRWISLRTVFWIAEIQVPIFVLDKSGIGALSEHRFREIVGGTFRAPCQRIIDARCSQLLLSCFASDCCPIPFLRSRR